MKVLKRISLSAALCGMLALSGFVSSCNSSEEDDNYTTHTLTNSFGCITSITSQAQTMSPSMTYVIKYDYSTGDATVEITGLQMPDGTKYPPIVLDGMKWKMKDNWRVIEAAAPHSSVSGFSGAPIFENLSIGLMDRIYNNSYIPAFYFKARVNTQYSLFSALNEQVFFGNTEITAPDGSVTSNRSTAYTFKLNPNTMPLTATINVVGAKFASAMPPQTFAFDDVPCTLNHNSTLSFEVESLIPTQNGVPNTGYPISDLSGIYDFVNGFDMQYDCMVSGRKFTAKADLDYISGPEE